MTDAQKGYLEMQMLSEQAEQMQQQLQLIEQRIAELTHISEALRELKTTKAGAETILPLGAGLYLKAHLAKTDEVLMNVGSETVIKKDLPDATEIISQQRAELTKIFGEAEAHFNSLQERMSQIQADLASSVK